MKKILPLIIVILFGLLAAKGLIGQGYFNMHDDLQMMRQLEMEKCFMTLQIPCRWVPDMGYGFGFPVFNFYPPLPYLFGEVFRLFGVAFTETVKLTFIFAFIASGISMYFLAKEFFGKWGGVISGIFYVWAPYHSVDIYVRGAMNEAWGIIFFPAILASSYKLLTQTQNKKRNIIFLALSWVGLLLSHNLMALIFAPVFAGWCLIWLLKDKKNFIINSVRIIFAGILALGLAAFFTLPVTFEQNLVHTESLVQGYYEYGAHFATTAQLLFSRFWGYGPSVWEANDGMSFQVGMLHSSISIVVVTIIAFLILRQIRKTKKLKIDSWMMVAVYFFIVGWFAVFMIHNKSTPIWLHISPLRFVQFPWRFLTLVILSFSFIAGSLVLIIPKKLNFLIFAIVGGVVIFSWNFFNVQHNKLGPLTDTQKFTGAAWDLQRTAGIYDYLPKTAVTAPKAPMTNFVEILVGQAVSSNIKLGTNTDSFNINVMQNAEVRIGVFQFPDWKVFLDGKEIPTFIPKTEEWGRIHILIPVGQHSVKVRLYDTPVRTIGNVISIVSWLGLGGYLMLQFKRGKQR
jgi:hypothetical protein